MNDLQIQIIQYRFRQQYFYNGYHHCVKPSTEYFFCVNHLFTLIIQFIYIYFGDTYTSKHVYNNKVRKFIIVKSSGQFFFFTLKIFVQNRNCLQPLQSSAVISKFLSFFNDSDKLQIVY